MKMAGFVGGGTIYSVASLSSMVAFYRAISDLVVPKTGHEMTLLTDRLYRRYLRLDELEPAVDEMAQVKRTFEEIRLADLEKFAPGFPGDIGSNANPDSTLEAIFKSHFTGFDKCVRSANHMFKTYNRYIPVMTVVAAIPDALRDFSDRPLAEFDDLEGPPRWLR